MFNFASEKGFKRYLASIERFPKLDRARELSLATAYHEGDKAQGDLLVSCNLRFVVKIAVGYCGYGFKLSELVAEGNIGLLQAVRRFEPERGLRFMTYASYWVRAHVLSYILKHWSLVGVGTGPMQSKLFFRLQREKAKLLARTGSSENITAKLAEKFQCTEDRIRRMEQRIDGRDLSLDAKAYRDGTVSILETLQGKDASQETALSRSEVSDLVRERVEEALTRFDNREQVIVRERLLGANHPDTAESRFNLGVLHRQMGRYDQARAEHERALEIRRDVFGPQHPKVADSLTALGSVALREGKPEQARSLYEEALDLQVAAFGPDHMAAARSHEALATLHAQTRAFDEARSHFAAALAVYQRRLSADHPRLGRVWMNLGSLEIDAGRPAAAREHLVRAAARFERVHGDQHPELGWTLATLGLAYHKERNRPEALRTLTRAASILETSQAEPLVRGTVQADLAEVLVDDDPNGARQAAATAQRLLSAAGAAGNKRLDELRGWHRDKLGEALPTAAGVSPD